MERVSTDRCSIRARWVFPVDGEPIENGTVEIQQGRITAVHGRGGSHATDLGNVALLPGLVNAHTHLEFSDLDAPLTPSHPFTEWIRAVVSHRSVRTTNPQRAIAAGIRECTDCGTTLLGEIATGDRTPASVPPNKPRMAIFRELIGLLPEQIDAQLAIAKSHLQIPNSELRTPNSAIYCLSPHAPYSVHPDLYQKLVDMAAAHRAPLAVHLAETKAELELLAHGRGEFLTLLKEFGVWREGEIPAKSRPLAYLQPLERLEHALIVHGNYLAENEIEFLAHRRHLTLIYCPRTHHYFGHVDHPWQRLLEAGGSVALGTDSRASNPDLNVWTEVQFLLQRHPDVDPRTLLRLATLNGARALGLEAETGTLTAGKSADIAVISLPNQDGRDPYQLLLHKKSRVTTSLDEV